MRSCDEVWNRRSGECPPGNFARVAGDRERASRDCYDLLMTTNENFAGKVSREGAGRENLRVVKSAGAFAATGGKNCPCQWVS